MQKSSISQRQLREFGFLIGIAFPIIIGWLMPAAGGHPFKVWSLWVGIPSLVIGVMRPRLLFYPYKGWMILGFALGWINSRIILGSIFLFILQPIALIMKLFGYDPLRKKRNNEITYKEIKKNEKVDLTRIF